MRCLPSPRTRATVGERGRGGQPWQGVGHPASVEKLGQEARPLGLGAWGRPMWRLLAGLRRGRQIRPELCTWCGDCGPRVLLVVGTKRRSLALSTTPLRTASRTPHRALPDCRCHALPSPCLTQPVTTLPVAGGLDGLDAGGRHRQHSNLRRHRGLNDAADKSPWNAPSWTI
ncbi:hypothetical protein VPH35_072728 [Triticum aestivum]